MNLVKTLTGTSLRGVKFANSPMIYSAQFDHEGKLRSAQKKDSRFKALPAQSVPEDSPRCRALQKIFDQLSS